MFFHANIVLNLEKYKLLTTWSISIIYCLYISLLENQNIVRDISGTDNPTDQIRTPKSWFDHSLHNHIYSLLRPSKTVGWGYGH